MVVEAVVGIIIDVPVTAVNHRVSEKVVLGVLGLDHVDPEVNLVIREGEGGKGIEAEVIAGVEVGVAVGVREVTARIVVAVVALHLVGVVEAEVQRVVENLVIAVEIVNVDILIHHNLTME